MKLFDPDPNLRWLFCMTHPDDEISICAWIKRLTAQGNQVFLSWSHSNDIREREAHKVAELLGVPPSHRQFFGAPDQGVVDHIPQLLEPYAEWMSKVRPDRVVCGAFEQGHLDHDATNFLVNQTSDGPVLEVPFYHAYLRKFMRLNRFADPTGQEVIALDSSQQRLKKTVARQYPSQRIWSNLVWYEIYQGVRLKAIELPKTERMRLQTHHDWLSPNLPEPLATRVRASKNWKRWERTIRPLLP
jgi:LmbE family N-acetylglucosaminyl deacetylase